MNIQTRTATFFNQELATTALRKEAASLLSDAAFRINYKEAGIDEVRGLLNRALEALEMSMPVVGGWE